MRFEESEAPTGWKLALLGLALVAILVAMTLPALAAKPMRWMPPMVGGAPCADVFLNPPDVAVDPDCGAMAGSSDLEAAATQNGAGALVEWDLSSDLDDNVTIAAFAVHRGLSPVALGEIGQTSPDARSFYDGWSPEDRGLWYQVVALDADGEPVARSKAVFAGPA